MSGTAGGVPPVPAFALAYSSKKRYNNSNMVDLRAATGECSTPKRNSLQSPGGSSHGGAFMSHNSNSKDPPALILDFLFLGSVDDAQDAKFLSSNNIKCIINVSTEEYWSVNKDVVVYPFRVEDSPDANISQFFSRTGEVIDKVRKEYFEHLRSDGEGDPPRVLVHCQKGRSRSATIVLAYLIRRNGWTLTQALNYVKSKRSSVEPNIGFIRSLQTLETSITSESRSRRTNDQSIIVRNISSKTSKQDIKVFFEKHVGCVRCVVIRLRETKNAEGNAEHVVENNSVEGEDCTLCMVFFVCFENVKRAKIFASERPKELHQLGPVSGKEIKFIVPSKIRAINGSFADSA